jgi:hypothetical protein
MAMQAAKSFLFFTRMKSQKPEDLTIERLMIDGSSRELNLRIDDSRGGRLADRGAPDLSNPDLQSFQSFNLSILQSFNL